MYNVHAMTTAACLILYLILWPWSMAFSVAKQHYSPIVGGQFTFHGWDPITNDLTWHYDYNKGATDTGTIMTSHQKEPLFKIEEDIT